LLPGDGLTLPNIFFPNLENLIVDPLKTHSPEIGGIQVLAKANELPPGAICFRPFFLQVSNGYSHMPIALKLFDTNDEAGGFFPFPLRESNEISFSEVLKELEK
jgi:hypothetical protein